MKLFETNKAAWETLLKRGALWSHLKDGVPKTGVQKIIGFGYPVLLIILIVISILASIFIPRKTWRWKSYIVSLLYASFIGSVWGIWMLHADPNFPAWLYPPWATSGVEFLQSIEDWLFYPACTSIFYIFYRLIHIEDESWNTLRNHVIIISIYVSLTIASLLIFNLAGRTEALMFALPGIIAYILVHKSVNVKKFVYVQIFVVLFGMIWDWFAASWLHYIPGMAWASEWVYITFDKAGNPYHSKVFLDYATHRWDWVFENPLEITPWFGICGGIVNYTLFIIADKIFYKNDSEGNS